MLGKIGKVLPAIRFGMLARQLAVRLLALSALFLATSPTQGASMIQFPVNTCTVTEGCGRLEIPIQRQNDPNAIVSVEVNTAPLTARSGTNYTEVATTLTFQAGETNKTVLVPILNNRLVEGTKTFQVRLSPPTEGASLGARTNLTVAIWDNDKGLHFYVPTILVSEEVGEAVIKVARGDDGDNRVTVDYATADGTAKAGQDYTSVTGTIAFDPGEVLKSFTVSILNDALRGHNQTFRVTLSNPTGGGVLGAPSSATVVITDTDQFVQFDSAKYYVREEAEFVQIRIVRGESDSAATLDFTTGDSSATAGLDYAGITNTLQFAAGERLKLLNIPILNDGLKETNETFRVTLSNPTGGAVLGTQRTATVTIADNDPGVGFTTNLFAASESTGVAQVTVVRGNDKLLDAFTVDFQTVDGTAHAGVDYQATSGTLEFKANDTLQSITIPILQNSAAMGPKSFKVTLSQASDGVLLGTATTVVKILHLGGYYPVLPLIDAKPKLQRENGVNLLSWEGEAALQHAERVTGPWEVLPRAASPYAIRPRVPMSFYRIQSPRPTEVYVPSGYDGKKPMPLIFFLHSRVSSSDYPDFVSALRGYFPLEPLAESRGFLVCYPIGNVDAAGEYFWNNFWQGTDFTGFSDPDMDDSGYLRSVTEEIQRRFAVDLKRIYVIGISAGANMSHRLACEQADLIAGIASISGRTYYDPKSVHPSQPVHVLQIDGTEDNYFGQIGTVAEMPGAVRTVQIWASLNGCKEPVMEAVPSFDLTPEVSGIDTTVLRYTQCPPGGAVELWTINGGGHVPDLTSESRARLVDWLLAHPKP